MSRTWDNLRSYFEDDDGSLPEIALKNLSASEVSAIYTFIRQHGEDITHGGSFYWDTENNCDRPLDFVPNAASLVIDGKADPFHFVVSQLIFQNAAIPDLGILITADEICLDYRMGKEWDALKLEALLEFLYQIGLLAPTLRVEMGDGNIVSPQNKIFASALENYIASKKGP